VSKDRHAAFAEIFPGGQPGFKGITTLKATRAALEQAAPPGTQAYLTGRDALQAAGNAARRQAVAQGFLEDGEAAFGKGDGGRGGQRRIVHLVPPQQAELQVPKACSRYDEVEVRTLVVDGAGLDHDLLPQSPERLAHLLRTRLKNGKYRWLRCSGNGGRRRLQDACLIPSDGFDRCPQELCVIQSYSGENGDERLEHVRCVPGAA